jgi:hypothetical protein
MSNDTTSSRDVESAPDEEAWHNAYFYFRTAIELATLPAEQQCEEMGDYNVAWELREDVAAGKYLLNRGQLSASQEEEVGRLVALVQLANVLPAGAGRQPNLLAMQHESWHPVRELAALVLKHLEQVTHANAAFFGGPQNAA